jgi:hypothetical protein
MLHLDLNLRSLSEAKLSEWKPYNSIKIKIIFNSSFQYELKVESTNYLRCVHLKYKVYDNIIE